MLRFLAKVGILLASQIYSTQAMDFDYVDGSDFPWIYAHGQLEAGDAEEFFSLYHDADGISLVVLDSDGGAIFEAMSLGKHIRSLGFDTLVPSGGRCLSACFFAMMAGNTRFVSPEGFLGVHQFNATYDNQSSEQIQSKTQTVTSALIEYVTDMGFDPTVLLRALVTPRDEIYIFSSNELDSFGINSQNLPVPNQAYDDTNKKALQSENCPFPLGFDVKDPMGLYPGCH